MNIPEYIEDLQAKGRYSVSGQALVSETGKSEKAVERALSATPASAAAGVQYS
jgi:hypothetical protein